MGGTFTPTFDPRTASLFGAALALVSTSGARRLTFDRS